MNMADPLVKPITTLAVDVHGHYGLYVDPHRDGSKTTNHWMTGDGPTVARRAAECGIEWTVVSPLLSLFPRGKAIAAKGNDEAAAVVAATPGLRQWVVVNPLQPETYRQAEYMLTTPWCVGIKIHPEEHVYPIKEHGAALFEFAARHRTVVLTHSGEENSLPIDFIPFMDRFPEAKLILAHLGMGWNGDPTLQVRAIQASQNGNVYTDTSSGRSVMSGLIEWAVSEIGSDRILFGTDTPLYFAAMQRMRIEMAEIPEKDRLKILSENARHLLKLTATPAYANGRTKASR